MRKIGQKNANLLRLFEIKGYIKKPYSNNAILCLLRNKYNEYLKSFNGIFFDKRFTYYFDIRRKEEFINFLVNKFFENNPNPSKEIKSKFTRLLHIHGLCWPGCLLHNKPKIAKEFIDRKENNSKSR